MLRLDVGGGSNIVDKVGIVTNADGSVYCSVMTKNNKRSSALAGAWTDNALHTWTCTFATNGAIRAYKDGAFQTSASHTWPMPATGAPNSVSMGADGGKTLICSLRSLYLFGNTKTAADVLALHNEALASEQYEPPPPRALLLCLHAARVDANLARRTS